MLDTPYPSATATALLAACAAAMRAERTAHAQVLATVAALDRAEVHPECGHPSVARLLEELLRVDRGAARTLLAQSRLLIAPDPDPLHPDAADPAPDLPATAVAAGEGDLDPAHIAVVAATMTRLRGIGSDPSAVAAGAAGPLQGPVLDEVERQLAALARERGPRQLDEAAAEIADRYDPDGAQPHDTERPAEQVHLSVNRRGVCTGRFRFADPDPDTGQALVDEIGARTPPPKPEDQTTTLRPGPDLAERRGEALRHLLDDARATRHGDDTAGAPENVDCPDCDAADGQRTRDHESGDGSRGVGSGDDPLSGQGAGDGVASGDLADLVDLSDLDERLDAALDHLLADPAASPTAGPTAGAPGDTASDLPGGPPGEPTPAAGGRPDPGPGSGPSRRDRPARDTTMIVTVPLELLEQRLQQPGSELGLLDGRYRLSAETARRLACDAGIVPAVLGSNGEVLDLGRKTRTVSTAQRRAVIARDHHCAFPGCRRSPKRCEVHHVIPWSRGGPTDLDHLVLLCTRHHQQIHHSPWAIVMNRGWPTFVPPAYLDPRRRPRTNAVHRSRVAA